MAATTYPDFKLTERSAGGYDDESAAVDVPCVFVAGGFGGAAPASTAPYDAFQPAPMFGHAGSKAHTKQATRIAEPFGIASRRP